MTTVFKFKYAFTLNYVSQNNLESPFTRNECHLTSAQEFEDCHWVVEHMPWYAIT